MAQKYSSSFTKDLIKAAEYGDVDSVSNLLASTCGLSEIGLGLAINSTLSKSEDAFQRTALHLASAHGHYSIVDTLLKAGANPNAVNAKNRTALHDACIGGFPEIAAQIASKVADIDASDNDNKTAAHLASYHGEAECLRILVKHGCNLSKCDRKGMTPAHLAVINNHADILRVILNAKGNMRIHSFDGQLPIHTAAKHQAFECLTVFAEFKVDLVSLDSSGLLPIHYAAISDSLKCAKFLVQQGSSIQEADNQGRTPLHLVCKLDFNLTTTLLNYSLAIYIYVHFLSTIFKYLDMEAAASGSSQVLHWLLQKGANKDRQDHNGNTASHLSAALAKLECLNCLMKHGADLSLPNNAGETSLDAARKFGHPVAFNDAESWRVRCPCCVKVEEQIQYEIDHEKTRVEKSIEKQESVIFQPTTNARTAGKTSRTTTTANSSRSHVDSSRQTGRTAKKASLPDRSLATKYYGQELFQFTPSTSKK
eukprot:gene16813-18509_t